MSGDQELQRELMAMARCDAINDAHRVLIGRVIARLGDSARGIEPEGRESTGPRAKPEEPGGEATRPGNGSQEGSTNHG